MYQVARTGTDCDGNQVDEFFNSDDVDLDEVVIEELLPEDLLPDVSDDYD